MCRPYADEVYCGDVSKLPFEDRSFDIVTAYSVLHHLYDYIKFLKEVYRVLDCGGILYTDYDHNALQWKKIIRRFIKKDKPSSSSTYGLVNYQNEFHGGIDAVELKKILKEIGFKRIRIFSFTRRQKTSSNLISLLCDPLIYTISEKGD